ncbi:NADH-quinone oxidoreductase subunit L [Nibrella saemangeumensis]|uniref:NADH-quinone oxidoreductase subunit L n=1 Tax=Nibrella saemangeumensis TaxID=1084526 RepID=A0ABP8NEX2_9BACT
MPDNPLSLLTFLLIGVLLLPFFGFLVVLNLPATRCSGWIAAGLTLIGLVISLALALLLPDEPVFLRRDWVSLPDVSLSISFQLDRLAVLMLLLVHFVALLVQVYSISYLHDEPRLNRYFAYLQLFTGAMLGIVLAGNLIILYAFWELVGLASYLLIGFWYERPAATSAAKKAFLMNRVGDAAFLFGIISMYHLIGTTELSAFGMAVPPGGMPTVVGLCLFMGCVAKSAQFPLLTWLPDAMEGPTPVSALLHAATMVATGIFLLARIHPVFSPDALLVITIIGTITALWGGYAALFQSDIKKVLAFSTVSQLGLMVAGMGTSNVSGAMFHLLTHAFFKAGLFLSAGAVIHAVHTQDMHQMGGLRKALPVTFWSYTLCAAALAGLPFFSGFLSKEAILAGALGWAAGQETNLAYGIPDVLLLSSGLTALYMARQWRLVFFGSYRNEAVAYPHLHEPDNLMRIPVLLLAVLSVAFWFSFNPFSAHDSWFFHWLPGNELVAPWWLAIVSIALVVLGGWLGFRMAEPRPAKFWVRASVDYGFLDQFYERGIINPVRLVSSLLYRADREVIDGVVDGTGMGSVVLAHMTHWIDRWFVDGFVNGSVWLTGRLGRLARSVQGGRVQSYIATAVAGLLLFLWWLL